MDPVQIRSICDAMDIDLNFVGTAYELDQVRALRGGYMLCHGESWSCINVGCTCDYFNPQSIDHPQDEIAQWLFDNGIDKLYCNNIKQFKYLDKRYTGYYCIVALWSNQMGIKFSVSMLDKLSRGFMSPYDV